MQSRHRSDPLSSRRRRHRCPVEQPIAISMVVGWPPWSRFCVPSRPGGQPHHPGGCNQHSTQATSAITGDTVAATCARGAATRRGRAASPRRSGCVEFVRIMWMPRPGDRADRAPAPRRAPTSRSPHVLASRTCPRSARPSREAGRSCSSPPLLAGSGRVDAS